MPDKLKKDGTVSHQGENGGRPPKTLDDLPQDWEKLIIDNMSEGASLEEIDGYLKIAKTTRLGLIEKDKTFSNAIKKGLVLSEKWWLEQGRKNLYNPKGFSAVLWYMNMKNRFGWKDKQETDITSGGEKLGGFIVLPKKEDK